MAILKVLKYPEKSLTEPSTPVETIDEEIQKLIRDMGETMFQESGVGLAAPQVGVNKRLIVYDVHAGEPDEERADADKEFAALINPEIISKQGSFISEEEGCLSVPEYRADVKRYERVTVRAQDPDGNEVEIEAQGLPSVIMQHEIDHLDGVLFIDRISSLKRAMYKKRVKKKMKEAQ